MVSCFATYNIINISNGVYACKIAISGVNNCTMNVHLLSHLPFYVKLYGPLWTHSAFVFEDGIGHLLKKAHGPHDIGTQVDTT